MPEKQKDINKTCSMDPAGPFSTPYVLSPGRTAPGAAPEDPYEAREKDKHWTLIFFSITQDEANGGLHCTAG